jgi:PAS domain S-box-containing protein
VTYSPHDAILDAVPAHIALIDVRGVIVTVNAAWRAFAESNGYRSSDFGVGRNYLSICDEAAGPCSEEAIAIGAGIRNVLLGTRPAFSMDYPCHAPNEQRWFRMTATPLDDGTHVGAVLMHVDVTERYLAEIAAKTAADEQTRLSQRLTTERERLVAAQEVAKIGSWETDLQSLTAIWSAEMFRIFGLDPALDAPDFAGFLARCHPDDRVRVDAAFRASSASRATYAVEHRIVMPDGSLKFVEERFRSLVAADGTPMRAIGTCQDITDRRAAEAALHRSEERFRQTFQSAAAGIVTTSVTGQYVDVNDAFARMLGYTRDELLQRSVRDVTHPDDVAESDRLIAELVEGTRRTAALHKRYLTKDGRTIWARLSVAASRDRDGQVAALVTVAIDITREREAESRNRTQAALLDAAHDGILVTTSEDRIVYWNKGAELIYGWSAEEAIGQTSVALLHQDAAAFTAARALLMESGRWEGEMQKRTKGGDERTMDVRWTLVHDEQGAGTQVLSIHTDVTERKRLEAQFFRSQRLESLGTLAGGIAHDLNNVLAPILVGVDLLRLKDADPLRLKALATMESSAKRGAELVRQMLSFARGNDADQRTLNVATLVRDVEAILHETLPKNITLRVEIPHETWTVHGDPTQLHQVLMNLAVNARDAMPEGGTLTLALANTTYDATYAGTHRHAKAGRFLSLIVSDTGTGMARSVLERLFEPFFTTKEPGRGTGLGLSTVHTIVEQHGGFVDVWSALGEGSRFTVAIPVAGDGALVEDPATVELAAAEGTGQLILVVDDEDSILAVVKQTLEVHGYRVLLARNGAEGVSAFVQHQESIAAVLTDLAMPVMDGPAMIVALRAISPDVRILVSSGLLSDAHLDATMRTGVTSFVPKPYTAETLLLALHRAVSPAG